MLCPITGKICEARKVYHITDIKRGEEPITKDVCENCLTEALGEKQPVINNRLKPKNDLIPYVPKEELDFKSALHLASYLLLLEHIKNKPIENQLLLPSNLSSKKCSCGLTFIELTTGSRLGCEKCYEIFEEELSLIFKQVQAEEKHRGKRPNSSKLEKRFVRNVTMLSDKGYSKTLARLTLKLNRHISEEKYEDAAIINNKIKKLKFYYLEKTNILKEMTDNASNVELLNSLKIKLENLFSEFNLD